MICVIDEIKGAVEYSRNSGFYTITNGVGVFDEKPICKDYSFDCFECNAMPTEDGVYTWRYNYPYFYATDGEDFKERLLTENNTLKIGLDGEYFPSQKFPAIVLSLPFTERPDSYGESLETTIDLWFLNTSNRENKNQEERIYNNIKPFINPMVENFLSALTKSTRYEVLERTMLPNAQFKDRPATVNKTDAVLLKIKLYLREGDCKNLINCKKNIKDGI